MGNIEATLDGLINSTYFVYSAISNNNLCEHGLEVNIDVNNNNNNNNSNNADENIYQSVH